MQKTILKVFFLFIAILCTHTGSANIRYIEMYKDSILWQDRDTLYITTRGDFSIFQVPDTIRKGGIVINIPYPDSVRLNIKNLCVIYDLPYNSPLDSLYSVIHIDKNNKANVIINAEGENTLMCSFPENTNYSPEYYGAGILNLSPATLTLRGDGTLKADMNIITSRYYISQGALIEIANKNSEFHCNIDNIYANRMHAIAWTGGRLFFNHNVKFNNECSLLGRKNSNANIYFDTPSHISDLSTGTNDSLWITQGNIYNISIGDSAFCHISPINNNDIEINELSSYSSNRKNKTIIKGGSIDSIGNINNLKIEDGRISMIRNVDTLQIDGGTFESWSYEGGITDCKETIINNGLFVLNNTYKALITTHEPCNIYLNGGTLSAIDTCNFIHINNSNTQIHIDSLQTIQYNENNRIIIKTNAEGALNDASLFRSVTSDSPDVYPLLYFNETCINNIATPYYNNYQNGYQTFFYDNLYNYNKIEIKAAIKRNITYNDTDDNSIDSQYQTYWEGVGLPTLPTPKRNGAKFIGWFDDTLQQIITKIDSLRKGDITLTALWEEQDVIVLDDFEDGDSFNNLGGEWYTSYSDYITTDLINSESGNSILITTLEHTSGITPQLHTTLTPKTKGIYRDISYTKGITFAHKGEKIELRIATPGGNQFIYHFQTIPYHSDWTNITILWENLLQQGAIEWNPKEVAYLTFSSLGDNNSANEYWLDNIHLLGNVIQTEAIQIASSSSRDTFYNGQLIELPININRGSRKILNINLSI